MDKTFDVELPPYDGNGIDSSATVEQFTTEFLSVMNTLFREQHFKEFVNLCGNETLSKYVNLYTIHVKPGQNTSVSYIEHQENVPIKEHQITPFLYAVMRNCVEIVEHMIQYNNANIEAECHLLLRDTSLIRGLCPLTIASFCSFSEMIDLLLNSGAQVDHPTQSLSTALRFACHNDDLPLMENLIKRGADVNMRNIFSHTPIMLAAYLGLNDACDILLKNGADIDHQALCGATALHFASIDSDEFTVSNLLRNGATFKTDDSGSSPLRVAAIHGRTSIVHEFLSIPSLTNFDEKVTALELLGASFISSTWTNGRFDMQNAFYFLKCALLLRYRGDIEMTCGCTCCNINDTLSNDEKTQLPTCPKNVLEATATYGFFTECQTYAQLASIEHDSTRLFFECLLVMERLLGSKNLFFSDTLKCCGAIFADNQQWVPAIRFWLRAMRIKINARIFIAMDFYHFYKLIEKMARYRQSNTEFIKCGLRAVIDYYTARPRPFGFRRLHFPSSYEEFTFNSHKRSSSIPSVDAEKGSFDPKTDSDALLMLVVWLLTHISKNFNNYSANDQQEFRELTYKLCCLNITESGSGRTLLHLSLSCDFHMDHLYDNLNPQIKFPSVNTALFLMSCGADVTALDLLYNTPLHYFSRFAFKDSSAKLDDQFQVIRMFQKNRISFLNVVPEVDPNGEVPKVCQLPLYYAGVTEAHLDAVNIFGQTPFKMNRSIITNIVLANLKHVDKLKCLAARCVHKLYFEPFAFKFKLYTTEKFIDRSHPNMGKYVQNFIPSHFGQLFEPNTRFPPDLIENLDYYTLNFVNLEHRAEDVERTFRRTQEFSELLSLSIELVQFIEMHGPHKFANM